MKFHKIRQVDANGNVILSSSLTEAKADDLFDVMKPVWKNQANISLEKADPFFVQTDTTFNLGAVVEMAFPPPDPLSPPGGTHPDITTLVNLRDPSVELNIMFVWEVDHFCAGPQGDCPDNTQASYVVLEAGRIIVAEDDMAQQGPGTPQPAGVVLAHEFGHFRSQNVHFEHETVFGTTFHDADCILHRNLMKPPAAPGDRGPHLTLRQSVKANTEPDP